jgi:VWFA-related protein
VKRKDKVSGGLSPKRKLPLGVYFGRTSNLIDLRVEIMRGPLCVLAGFVVLGLNVFSQQAAVPPTAARTPEKPRISLDVVVTDKAGKAAGELEPSDLTLLDNNQPRKILSFRRTEASTGSRFDPPVEVILVIDAVNLPYQAVTSQRLEVEKFLRLNNGLLAFPTSVFLYTSEGLHVQPAPSKDGNALAKVLDKATGVVRARDLSGGVYSLNEQFQDSFKTMQGIAENEARKPGRKVLIWVGPGWPLLTERFFIESDESRQNYFHQLATLTNQLRKARITVYNVAPIVGVTRDLYKGYLKPVTEARKMEVADLALEVMAVNTGGRVLDPSNYLSELIMKCESDIGPYYTITFEPPQAAGTDEFHSLRVLISGDGLTARTESGYFDEP